MKTWIIYKHTLLIGEHAGWSYIGQTCKEDASKRWQCGTGYKSCQVFWRAIRKYGWSAFSHEIIETGIETLEEANEREKYWIAYYHTYLYDPECRGYNMTPGGSCGYWVEKQLPQDVKQKISIAHKGLKLGSETIKKLKAIRKKHYSDPANRRKQHNAATTRKPVFCLETGEVFDSVSDAARRYNLNASSQISSAIIYKCKAAGYHWTYNTEENIAELKQYVATHVPGAHPPCSEESKLSHSLGCTSKRKVMCIETGKVYNSIKEAKIDTGCGSSIFSSLKDKTKTSLGLHWRYCDEK